ncbi:MAG TPA: zinc ribbon domain-containing protein, partial [Gemmatimonadales bacterium]|nr:zinc ribbon domain-containing protein [Gemmatimonadales bacterium]
REVRDEQGKPVRFARNHVPEEHWVVVEDAHPAIVERCTFETTRRRLAEKAKPRRWSTSVEPFVLSGLMRCATCGDVLVGGGGTRFGAGDPGATRFYRCRNSNGDAATCVKPMLTINQRLIEREVIGRVSAHVSQLVKSGKLAQLLDERLHLGAETQVEEALGRELQGLEAKRRTIVEKIAEGVITDNDARETLATIKTRLKTVGAELQAAKIKPTRSDQKAEKARLLKLAADFPALIKKVPVPVARELLSYWVEGVTLDKRGRVGTLTLRRVPASSSSSGNQVPRGAARRCSPGGSPPSCRR